MTFAIGFILGILFWHFTYASSLREVLKRAESGETRYFRLWLKVAGNRWK